MLSILLSSILLFHYVQVPVVSMRQAPTQEAEIVSEALFSEEVKIIDKNGEWVKIETSVDGCSGWITQDALYARADTYADCSCVTPIVEVNRLAAHVYEKKNIVVGPLFTLPFASRLEADLCDEYDSSWIKVIFPNEKIGYIQRGDVTTEIQAMTKEEMAHFSKRFLGLPFTWGGRSSFGYDDPGFIQMLYQQMGFFIPRYSKDQLHWEGFESIAIGELERGDLIFWGSSEQDIHHVGLYIGDSQFIHATMKEDQPWLRVNSLDEPLYSGNAEWVFRACRRLKS